MIEKETRYHGKAEPEQQTEQEQPEQQYAKQPQWQFPEQSQRKRLLLDDNTVVASPNP